jgi:hypothetical protein
VTFTGCSTLALTTIAERFMDVASARVVMHAWLGPLLMVGGWVPVGWRLLPRSARTIASAEAASSAERTSAKRGGLRTPRMMAVVVNNVQTNVAAASRCAFARSDSANAQTKGGFRMTFTFAASVVAEPSRGRDPNPGPC